MNDANPRQQIVDSIKNNNNVLVTVSTNPSVDELSAALGLTILLNTMGKRGTAVVSGQIPPAIKFLDPEKVFEHTTDSLRDFIIALDKEKADHLRYKVEGDVVKIFITPYRTQLGEKDLEFSLGDYNVEAVIALGVKDQEHLDKALDSHSAILHDATVATLTAGNDGSSLGSINWQDQSASSLCEMLVSLSEALKEDKPLLDEQTSTAFLTGIVSATDRFSNDHTTSRVMTMAAQLMAAGANQQLIAAKLEEAHDIAPGPVQGGARATSDHPDGTTSLTEGGAPAPLNRDRKKNKKGKKAEDGLLIEIDHPEPVEKPASVPTATPEMPAEETTEEKLARELADVAPPEPSLPADNLAQELASASGDESTLPPVSEPAPQGAMPTLNFEALLPKTEAPAPTEAADLNPVPSTSGYLSQDPAVNDAPASDAPDAPVDPFSTPLISPTLPPLQPDPLFESQQAAERAPAIAQTITPVHTPDEIEYEESPIPNDPAAVAAVPDFAAMNPTGLANLGGDMPGMPPALPSLDSLPPPPPLPPLPDLSTPPPPPDLSLPAAPPPVASDSNTPPPLPPPGQFKIPGQ